MNIEIGKVLIDNYYFKDGIDYKEGLEVTSPKQIYKLSDNTCWFVSQQPQYLTLLY